MPHALKYIKDGSGHKTSVVVPIKVWEDLNASYQTLQKKLTIINGIRSGLSEIRQSKKTGKKLQILKKFSTIKN
jgi:hypothetical protein